jgi:hypothetical protein
MLACRIEECPKLESERRKKIGFVNRLGDGGGGTDW